LKCTPTLTFAEDGFVYRLDCSLRALTARA
jgi:hypothetical protein